MSETPGAYGTPAVAAGLKFLRLDTYNFVIWTALHGTPSHKALWDAWPDHSAAAPVSAGFVVIPASAPICAGGSTSLGIASAPDDSEALGLALRLANPILGHDLSGVPTEELLAELSRRGVMEGD